MMESPQVSSDPRSQQQEGSRRGRKPHSVLDASQANHGGAGQRVEEAVQPSVTSPVPRYVAPRRTPVVMDPTASQPQRPSYRVQWRPQPLTTINVTAPELEEPTYGEPLPVQHFILDTQTMPLFTAHKTLFTCMLTSNGAIEKDDLLPVVSEHRLKNLDQLKGGKLKRGSQTMEQRQEQWTRVLSQSVSRERAFAFMNTWRRGTQQLPFVGLADLFVSLMQIPLGVQDTVVLHAWIETGTHIRLMRGRGGMDETRSNADYGCSLVDMLLQESLNDGEESDTDSDDSLHSFPAYMGTGERDTHFKFSEVRFGRHLLIPMSEVSAVDEDGNDLLVLTRDELRTPEARREWSAKRYSEAWAHAALVDQKRLVTAVKDETASICGVAVAPILRQDQQLGPCLQMYDFLDRFLACVRKELQDATTGRVVSFKYTRGTTHIIPMVQSAPFSGKTKRIGGSTSPYVSVYTRITGNQHNQF